MSTPPLRVSKISLVYRCSHVDVKLAITKASPVDCYTMYIKNAYGNIRSDTVPVALANFPSSLTDRISCEQIFSKLARAVSPRSFSCRFSNVNNL